MLRRISFAFLLLLMIVCDSKAQEISLGLGVGYDTFWMGNVKDFQGMLARGLPFNAQVLESFPAYADFSLSCMKSYPKWYWGGIVGHTSTGGRVYYSDYSGSIALDQLIRMNYLTAVIAQDLNPAAKTHFLLGADFTACLNTFLFDVTTQVGTQNDIEEDSFKGLTPGIGAFLGLQRGFGRFTLQGRLGGDLFLRANLQLRGTNDTYLASGGKFVKINPSGLRSVLCLAYRLK